MAALTENAILVTVKWDHKGYKSQKTNIFKNSKFYEKKQNGRLISG